MRLMRKIIMFYSIIKSTCPIADPWVEKKHKDD